MTRARAAATRADLGVLFADLPQAGPAQEPTGTVAASGTRGFLDSKRDTIIALTPFAALALFFLTGSWLWFLMIPVMGSGCTGQTEGRNHLIGGVDQPRSVTPGRDQCLIRGSPPRSLSTRMCASLCGSASCRYRA